LFVQRSAILFVLLLFFALTPVSGLTAQDSESRLPVTGEEPAAAFPFEEAFAEEETLKVRDPLEPVNRGIFWVNDKLYFYLFKPVARGLRIVPEPARVSAGNFFYNLGSPVRFANALLQLKFGDASDELARFIFNTTFGIAGLFDIAREQGGISRKDEDFGQTLGHYGAGPGFYLVLPLLGPSNARDAVGRVGDYFLDPLTYALGEGERIAVKAVDRENALSLDKETYEGIVRDELDPYLFIRNAYTQRRQALLAK
jgi:phospholipid-binding lipoprotein MlaA